MLVNQPESSLPVVACGHRLQADLRHEARFSQIRSSSPSASEPGRPGGGSPPASRPAPLPSGPCRLYWHRAWTAPPRAGSSCERPWRLYSMRARACIGLDNASSSLHIQGAMRKPRERCKRSGAVAHHPHPQRRRSDERPHASPFSGPSIDVPNTDRLRGLSRVPSSPNGRRSRPALPGPRADGAGSRA